MGNNIKIPATFKHKVSYDSLADLIVYFTLHPRLYAGNDIQFLTDFFFTPAEANPVAGILISVITAAVIEAAGFVLAVLTMPLDLQNMPRAIWGRSPIASIAGSSSTGFPCVCSWPPSPLGRAQRFGFARLKHLANQVFQ